MTTINIIINTQEDETDELAMYGSGEGQEVVIDEDTLELEPDGAECRKPTQTKSRRRKKVARKMGFVHF